VLFKIEVIQLKKTCLEREKNMNKMLQDVLHIGSV